MKFEKNKKYVYEPTHQIIYFIKHEGGRFYFFKSNDLLPIDFDLKEARLINEF